MTTTLVLVVDDEPAMLKVSEMTLLGAGYEVITYDDPLEALEELRDGLRPDVVVSDVSMPSMNGFEFYASVREIAELRGVPFLFLTALEDRASMRKGMTLGADDYLTKPVQREELLAAVEVRLRRVAELRKPLTGVVAVHGFGHPMVLKGGERLDWDSLKALELLFYLLEHRSGVTTFEVAEALWPGKSESKASSSFHTTLYRLRKVMGGDLVESANRRYYLHDRFSIEYDVEAYRRLATKARESGSLRDYQKAARLYAGHFLVGFDSPWIDSIRLNLQATHLTLLEAAAETARIDNDLAHATMLYQLMTEHEPYSEVAWEGLASTWEARGERQRAQEARERFERLMDEG
ncbi:MAG: response regulator [Deinococcales bacterium]|mgnify:CR=1 FL=1|nr:response regulator [Deinococcales bacterium]